MACPPPSGTIHVTPVGLRWVAQAVYLDLLIESDEPIPPLVSHMIGHCTQWSGSVSIVDPNGREIGLEPPEFEGFGIFSIGDPKELYPPGRQYRDMGIQGFWPSYDLTDDHTRVVQVVPLRTPGMQVNSGMCTVRLSQNIGACIDRCKSLPLMPADITTILDVDTEPRRVPARWAMLD
jgi:hypothetical protein